MYSHAPVSTNGSRSLAHPGSIPEVKHDTPPVSHAVSSWLRTLGCTCGG
jgi:hypothetical protein